MTDGVGHRFGPNSVEQQNQFLRLDRKLAGLFEFVGKGQYTTFLTAGHGVVDMPEFLEKIKTDLAGAFDDEHFVNAMSSGLIYLDKKAMKTKKVTLDEVQEVIRGTISRMPYVSNVVSLRKLNQETLTDYQSALSVNDYNPKLSGDFLLVIRPQWIGRGKVGTISTLLRILQPGGSIGKIIGEAIAK